MKSASWLWVVALCLALMPATPAACADDDPILLTVGAFAAPGSPWDQQWKHYKRTVEERSEGRIRVKLLTRGEAGGEATTMTFIRRNRLQFGGFTLSGVTPVVPELDILLTPFFFADRAELDFVMDRYMLDMFQQLFEEKGLMLAYWVEVGWLNFYGRTPVLTPADMKGQRMRVQASRAASVLANSLQADPIEMEFAELIPGLQTGLVFGGETNAILYALTGIAGEAPHMTLTQHSYDTGVIVGNRDFVKSLPEDLQTVVMNGFPPSDVARKQVRGVADALLGKLRAENVQLHTLTPDQRAAWEAATAENYKTLIAQIGGKAEQIYDRMLEGRTAYRARFGASGEAAQ